MCAARHASTRIILSEFEKDVPPFHHVFLFGDLNYRFRFENPPVYTPITTPNVLASNMALTDSPGITSFSPEGARVGVIKSVSTAEIELHDDDDQTRCMRRCDRHDLPQSLAVPGSAGSGSGASGGRVNDDGDLESESDSAPDSPTIMTEER